MKGLKHASTVIRTANFRPISITCRGSSGKFFGLDEVSTALLAVILLFLS